MAADLTSPNQQQLAAADLTAANQQHQHHQQQLDKIYNSSSSYHPQESEQVMCENGDD